MFAVILLCIFLKYWIVSGLDYKIESEGLSISQSGFIFVHNDALGTMKGIQFKICLKEGNCQQVDQFLKIPYAKPPISDLRFAPPEEYEGKFSESNDFTTKAPACMQSAPTWDFDKKNPASKIWWPDNMNEDCLYLNIWRPTDAMDFSVMVWIFGGGFFSGSASLDVYDGRILAASESIIVASMQYRVGAFGFLYTPPWSKGNMGLLDQQLALKWIFNHINAFGGSNQKITIFGESAGSASVGFHLMNSNSRQYFRRAIMQSASPFNRWALSTESQAKDVGEAVSKIISVILNISYILLLLAYNINVCFYT